MKKSIKKVLISSLIILLVLIQGQSFAATNSLTLALTPDKTEIKAGETVTVLVQVSNIQGEGIIGFNANVNYDANIFECTAEGDPSGAWTRQGFIENNLTTARADLLANSENQTVAKLIFKAKDDVTVGEKTISLSNVEFATENESYNVADVQVKVKIVEDTKPEDTKPEDTKPEDTKPEDTKPEDTKPEDTKPEDTKPEDTKPDGTTPENTKPGNTTTGDNTTSGTVNKTENTQSSTKLPHAGLNNVVVIGIGIAMIATGVFLFQYKKYKNI